MTTLKCTRCGRPAKEWNPIGGAPISDCLCTRHRIEANLKNPMTYISLVHASIFMGIGYAIYRVARWLLGTN